ncbi:hypothetical protein [Photobacterium alginatilyticum]|uniref:Uncharacterized protein n=1 Tax=Photobacterium alginatilyticum TaxID=1775171 RepID=A0ABW9YS22_9GAMM|nr:hypothetical protein [Photobacterium alginatilyticum]NBI56261.1 hypothetical protein [Photobacterium alginatilyticum]
MEIIKLLSAFGLGGICVKAFDLIYLQPYLERKEIRNWLRDKKLVAFSKLASNFQSMGFNSENDSFFADLALIAEAQLLIDDEELCLRIEALIEKRHELNHTHDVNNEIELFDEVQAEVKAIMQELKQDLRNSKA